MSDITLLDGGMGQELLRRSGDAPTPLWATRVMADHPGLVQGIHADYYTAGASVATTNTYALHRDRLDGTPLADRFDALMTAALNEARAAREAHGTGRIAGAIGPLMASYRPEIHPAADVAVPLYRELAERLAPWVDLILCETVASLDHARTVLAGTAGAGVPVWLAVTVQDSDGTHLRSGEPVADICAIAKGRAQAVLVNCSAPEAMGDAIDALAAADLPRGAYANAFERITEDYLKDNADVSALTGRRDMGPDAYATHAMGWIDRGATILGGCCETGPAHIAELARRLRAAGHSIV